MQFYIIQLVICLFLQIMGRNKTQIKEQARIRTSL